MWWRTAVRSRPEEMSSIASSSRRVGSRGSTAGSRGGSAATRGTVPGRRLPGMVDASRSGAGRGDSGGAEARRTIRVFLLDDHEVVRRGLRELLESEDDIEVVGEAGTAEEAVNRIPPTRPDVAVLDVRLPDGNGVEVCREVRSTHPEIQCLILTSFADDEALF